MSATSRFVWYDLMTPEPGSSVGFYTGLVSWGTQPWDGPAPYTLWTNRGTPLGGVMQLPEEARAAGAPPHWLAYVSVADVDATVETAGALGAAVLVPGTDIPNTGRFAVLRDPQGAVFAVFTPAQPMPETPWPPAAGAFSWHELMTTDAVAAFEFYHTLFGWAKEDALDMGEAGIYQTYGWGRGPVGGVCNTPPGVEAPPHWLYYIRVTDLEAAVAYVQAHGGKLFNGPMDVPGGDRIAQCCDEQGAAFALHELGGQG